jgi:hypothetical protein
MLSGPKTDRFEKTNILSLPGLEHRSLGRLGRSLAIPTALSRIIIQLNSILIYLRANLTAPEANYKVSTTT